MNLWKMLIKVKCKNEKKTSSFMYMWRTHVSEKNWTFLGFHNHFEN
jgi:hypothetical protein